MPIIKAFSRLERVYLKSEVTFGTAVVPTGASVARIIKVGLGNDVNLLRRRDKTGSRTGVIGVRGRIAAKWSLEASLVGSGTVGTVPPHDVIYQMLFGQTATTGAITAPAGVTATGHPTGGTLAAGTYYYVVTALNTQGESLKSSEVNAVVTGTTSSVTVSWTPDPGATSYRVYKGTVAATETSYFVSFSSTFLDTGAAGTAGTPPGGSTTGNTADYTLSDNIISGDIWSYRRPSTVEQRVSIGSVLQNFEFTLGQDIAEFRCDGESLYMLGSTNFSTADVTGKGGLGSFPAEPTPAYADGGLIAGFTGAININNQTLVNFRQCTIKGNTGNALVRDVFGTYYPSSAEGDERQFTFSFNMYDDDSAGLAVLKEAADKKTPVGATIQIGTVPGNIATFTLNGIQLLSPTYDDSQRSYVVTVPDSPFKGSDPAALDELALAWT